MTNKEEHIENLLKNIPKNWKEKVEQYELVLAAIEDGCSVNLFDSNSMFLKEMIDECNAFALEKALEVIIAYLRKSNIGKKIFLSELSIFIDKCYKSSRQQTRNFGNDIFVILAEKGLSEVFECLLSFIVDNNKPTIVNGVIEALIQIIKKYKIISIKKLLQSIPKLFESRDKQTRTLTKSLTLAIGTKYGRNTIDGLLKELKPIHSNEIRSELDEVIAAQPLSQEECNEDDSSLEKETRINLPLVDLNALLVPAFFDQLDGTRQDRKDALDNLNLKIENKSIPNGNHRELVSKLCQIVTKDSQINSIQVAIGILTNIAKCTRRNFTNCSLIVIEACLEKFKEKKPSVVTLLRECIDVAYSSTTFDQCVTIILDFLDNKNPSIRLETVSFILRVSANKRSNDAIRKHMKNLLPILRKLCDDSVLDVRDQTFQLIGRLSSHNNRKMIDEVLKGLDNAKIQRIKTFVTKDAIVQIPTTETENAIVKVNKPIVAKFINKNIEPEIVDLPKRNLALVTKPQKEIELSTSIIEEKYIEIFGQENIKKMSSAVWQNRLSVMDFVLDYVKKSHLDKVGCQIVVRFMLVKPGLKESNIAVLKKKIEIIQIIFRDQNGSSMIAEKCVSEIVEKVADTKVGPMSKSVLNLLFNTFHDLTRVIIDALKSSIDSKSVKCMAEFVDWLNGYLNNHETRIFTPKESIPLIKQLLSISNQKVKENTAVLIATIYKRCGQYIVYTFENEKSVIREMIEKEVAKVEHSKREEKIAAVKKETIVKSEKSQSEQISINTSKEESNVTCSNNIHERSFDFKDDVRSFVLDLCQNLNLYADKYSSSTFELELGEVLSSTMLMGNDKTQRSLLLLNSCFKRSVVTSQSTFTQTDMISDQSEPLVFETPQRNLITFRKGKRGGAHNKENKDLEHPIFKDYSEKPQIFAERVNTIEIPMSASTMHDLTHKLVNSTDQFVVNDVLSKMYQLLNSENSLHVKEYAPRIVPAVLTRMIRITQGKKYDMDQNRSNEIVSSVLILSTIYKQKHLCCIIDDDITFELLNLLCNLINNIKDQNYHNSNDIHKNLNNLILTIVENTDITKILYSLLNILDQCFKDRHYKSTFTVMVVKLIWNRTKLIKEKVLCEDYLIKILKVINGQFYTYLTDAEVVNSLAFKSVKTVIDNLTKIKGLSLLTYLPEDDNANLKSYIHRCQERACKI